MFPYVRPAAAIYVIFGQKQGNFLCFWYVYVTFFRKFDKFAIVWPGTITTFHKSQNHDGGHLLCTGEKTQGFNSIIHRIRCFVYVQCIRSSWEYVYVQLIRCFVCIWSVIPLSLSPYLRARCVHVSCSCALDFWKILSDYYTIYKLLHLCSHFYVARSRAQIVYG